MCSEWHIATFRLFALTFYCEEIFSIRKNEKFVEFRELSISAIFSGLQISPEFLKMKMYFRNAIYHFRTEKNNFKTCSGQLGADAELLTHRESTWFHRFFDSVFLRTGGNVFLKLRFFKIIFLYKLKIKFR